MNNLFSEMGIPFWDFSFISVTFIVTMLSFFVIRDNQSSWRKFLVILPFTLLSLLYILFQDGLRIKVFAGLMLTSTLIVAGLVTRRRKLGVRDRSALG
jgi:hypothetical protein